MRRSSEAQTRTQRHATDPCDNWPNCHQVMINSLAGPALPTCWMEAEATTCSTAGRVSACPGLGRGAAHCARKGVRMNLDVFRNAPPTCSPGGAGPDVLRGNRGNDTFIISTFNDDTLIESPDEGVDTVRTSFTAAAPYMQRCAAPPATRAARAETMPGTYQRGAQHPRWRAALPLAAPLFAAA